MLTIIFLYLVDKVNAFWQYMIFNLFTGLDEINFILIKIT